MIMVLNLEFRCVCMRGMLGFEGCRGVKFRLGSSRGRWTHLRKQLQGDANEQEVSGRTDNAHWWQLKKSGLQEILMTGVYASHETVNNRGHVL